MSPGVAEEGGKIAVSVIDSMKSQPMLLAMVIFNVIFVAAVFWGVKDHRAQTAELIKIMLAQSDKAQTLLAQCQQSAAKPQQFKLQSDESKPAEVQ